MSASSGNGNKLIVGVDDDVENLAMLKHAIEAAGYAFIGMTNGSECVDILSQFEPRLLLLDIEMPDMNGFETCRRIRAECNLPHMPIAFLTGRKSREDVKRCLAVGGNDFIIKPFEVLTLLNRLRYWTTRRVQPKLLAVAPD
jgi:DNA-binding response OmpR family regulator